MYLNKITKNFKKNHKNSQKKFKKNNSQKNFTKKIQKKKTEKNIEKKNKTKKITFEKLAPFIPATAFTIFANLEFFLLHVDTSKSRNELKKNSLRSAFYTFFFVAYSDFFGFFRRVWKFLKM
jgi:hypothetical protein